MIMGLTQTRIIYILLMVQDWDYKKTLSVLPSFSALPKPDSRPIEYHHKQKTRNSKILFKEIPELKNLIRCDHMIKGSGLRVVFWYENSNKTLFRIEITSNKHIQALLRLLAFHLAKYRNIRNIIQAINMIWWW